MERTFDTFIFDLDGTLLDTVPDLTLLTNRILHELGCPEHTQEEILSYVGAGVRRLMYQALPSDASAELTDKALSLWNQLFADYHEHTEPFPGIPEMLAALRELGCGIGVVSNKQQAGVDLIMAKKLPGITSVMFGESPLIPRKPDPTGIETAMKLLKTAPEDTLYVGDSPNDIVAARNVGTASAAVLWGYHKREDFAEADAVPDYYIEKPADLVLLARSYRNHPAA